MFITFVIVALIVALGTRATDNLRVRQQEVILGNLPEAEALTYYIVLRRRVRRIAVMRVIALLAVVALFYSYKRHYVDPGVQGGTEERRPRGGAPP